MQTSVIPSKKKLGRVQSVSAGWATKGEGDREVISLVLRGKIPVSEDVVTAAVFDHVRNARDPVSWICRLVSAARHISGVVPTPLPEFDSIAVELWPTTQAGEPDVRIAARCNGRTVVRIIVEAKLGAHKSGEGDVCLDKGTGDQLARYLLGEMDAGDGTLRLIYLTHHAALPRCDIEDSCRVLRDAGREDLIDGLLWLSWRDVEALFEEPTGRDVRELLRRVKMYRFTGMRVSGAVRGLASPRFYTRVGTSCRERGFAFGSHGARLQVGDVRRWRYRRRARAYVWPSLDGWTPRPRFYFRGDK